MLQILTLSFVSVCVIVFGLISYNLFVKNNQKLAVISALIFSVIFFVGSLGITAFNNELPRYDLDLFPAAILSVKHHLNFYYVNNLALFSQHELSMPHLYFWVKIVSFTTFGGYRMYLLYFFMLYILSYFLIPKKKGQFLEAFLYITTGFVGSYWSLHQSNLEPFSFCLLALSFRFMYKERWALACFVLGIASSIKLLPILLFIPILIRLYLDKFPIKKSVACAGYLSAGFAIPHGISYLILPQYYASYWQLVLGKLPNQHSPVGELSDSKNLSWILFEKISGFANQFGFTISLLEFALICSLIAMVIGLSLCVYYKEKIKSIQLSNDKIMWLGCFIMLCLMPRIKPYTYTIFAIPLFFLIQEYSWKIRRWFLYCAVCIPMLFTVLHKHRVTLAPWYDLPSFICLVSSHIQKLMVLTCIMMILILLWKKNYQHE